MSNIEQTLSIIKPDAVERSLENEIKEMFKNNGFSILKEKKIQIEKSEAENFYKVHETKPFYNELCEYLSSGPIVVMVLEKENAVLGNRELMGATNPQDAKEGTIRKKYGISIDKNSVHGSDSVENAKIEIGQYKNDSCHVIPEEKSFPNLWIQLIEVEIKIADHLIQKADGLGIENQNEDIFLEINEKSTFLIFRL